MLEVVVVIVVDVVVDVKVAVVQGCILVLRIIFFSYFLKYIIWREYMIFFSFGE